MAATPATSFSADMTRITNNAAGALMDLPKVTTYGARERTIVAPITLASQVNGSVIGIARLPLGAAITGIEMITDTSLGSSTIAVGNSGNGNSAIYAAAATLTATQTPTLRGKAATKGVPITSGFDCVSGLASTVWEDVTLTVGAADMPASGLFVVTIRYVQD